MKLGMMKVVILKEESKNTLNILNWIVIKKHMKNCNIQWYDHLNLQ